MREWEVGWGGWGGGQERVFLGKMGGCTGKNSHGWRVQDSGACCRGGKGREYLNDNLRRWILQPGQELPVCVLLALIPPSHCLISSLWITPLPQSCFSLLVQEFVGRLLKNKIKHSYLQTVIRHRTWDVWVYTAFNKQALLVQLVIGKSD